MKSKFLKSKKPPGLMLTSLLDMFTIILIFLIVSFEAEDHEFQLADGVELPESTSRSVFKPAVNVAITDKQILVEKEPIVDFDGPRPSQEFYDQGQIPALVTKLEGNYQKFLEDRQDDPEAEAIILVQADKDLEYKTLYLVLRSASVAGFSKYRMATMKK
jgi:biopolymer transport protein ExbD